MNAYQIRAEVIAMLSAETGCEPSQLTDGDVHVVRRKPENLKLAEHRNFEFSDGRVSIVSTGYGAVISVDEDDIGWAQQAFAHKSRDEVFSPSGLNQAASVCVDRGLVLRGPHPVFTVIKSELAQPAVPSRFEVNVLTDVRDIANLKSDVEPGTFPHTLAHDHQQPHRPEAVVTTAVYDEKVIGAASIRKDSDFFYQVGLDVAPQHQGKGIGTALTSAISHAAFNMRGIPYYGCSPSNIKSMRTALSVGYRPAWVEVFCV